MKRSLRERVSAPHSSDFEFYGDAKVIRGVDPLENLSDFEDGSADYSSRRSSLGWGATMMMMAPQPQPDSPGQSEVVFNGASPLPPDPTPFSDDERPPKPKKSHKKRVSAATVIPALTTSVLGNSAAPVLMFSAAALRKSKGGPQQQKPRKAAASKKKKAAERDEFDESDDEEPAPRPKGDGNDDEANAGEPSYEDMRRARIMRNRELLMSLNMSEVVGNTPGIDDGTGWGSDGEAKRKKKGTYKKRGSIDPELLRRSYRIKGLRPDGTEGVPDSEEEQQQLRALFGDPKKAGKVPKAQENVVIPSTLDVTAAMRTPPNKEECHTSELFTKLRETIFPHAAAAAESSAAPPQPREEKAEADAEGDTTANSEAEDEERTEKEEDEEEKEAKDEEEEETEPTVPELKGGKGRSLKQRQRIARAAQAEVIEKYEAMGIEESRVKRLTVDRVFTLAVLDRSDSDVVAAGSVHGDIALWHLSGDSSGVFTAHSGHRPVSGLSFVPGGSVLWSAGYDGSVRRLSVETGVLSTVISSDLIPDGRKASQKFGMCGMCLNPTGDVAVCGTLNGCIVTIDHRMPDNPVAAVSAHGSKIYTVQLHPTDENVCVTASMDGYAALWDLRMLLGRVRHQQSIAELASAERGRTPMEVRGCLASYNHDDSVNSAFISPHGLHPLVTNCVGGRIRVWDACMGTFVTGMPPDNELKHDNRTGRLITCFQAIWDPHHEGLALIGSLNKKLRLFGSWPPPSVSSVDRYLGSGLLAAVPAVNVFHPRKEYSIVSATDKGYVAWWQ